MEHAAPESHSATNELIVSLESSNLSISRNPSSGNAVRPIRAKALPWLRPFLPAFRIFRELGGTSEQIVRLLPDMGLPAFRSATLRKYLAGPCSDDELEAVAALRAWQRAFFSGLMPDPSTGKAFRTPDSAMRGADRVRGLPTEGPGVAALGALKMAYRAGALPRVSYALRTAPDVVAACRALGMSSADVAQELARAGFALSSPATLKRRAPRREREIKDVGRFLAFAHEKALSRLVEAAGTRPADRPVEKEALSPRGPAAVRDQETVQRKTSRRELPRFDDVKAKLRRGERPNESEMRILRDGLHPLVFEALKQRPASLEECSARAIFLDLDGLFAATLRNNPLYAPLNELSASGRAGSLNEALNILGFDDFRSYERAVGDGRKGLAAYS